MKENRLKVKLLRISQFLTWFAIAPFFKLCFDLEIRGNENLREISSPFIMISNHISFYDSFLFRLALGFRTPHLPLRFLAVRKFDWKLLNFMRYTGAMDLVYFLFGVITINQGEGVEKNLEKAIAVINRGGNVVIFPEGRIMKSGIGSFKIGSATLAIKTGVPIIPVSFRKWPGQSIRTRFSINIGQPILVGSLEDTYAITKQLYDAIVNLYEH